jgi:hypothetical protein
MSDNGKGVWASLLSLARDKNHPAGLFFFIIFIIGAMAAMMAFPMILAAIVTTGTGIISGKTPIQSIWRNCYDLKEVGGKIYKIDQCGGKIERYNPDDDED